MTPEDPPAFNLTELDRQLLSMTDDEFTPHDWEDLKSIVARNDLGALMRKPSDLVRYLSWTKETKSQFGSMMNYILQRRLHWSESESTSTADRTATTPIVVPCNNPIPFADPADYRILRNDWPYGMAPGITHLVVWMRTPVATKEDGGDMTDESRQLVEEFVKTTFVGRLAKEPTLFEDPEAHVLWFKNWAALQSVRALEHVHVLVRDVPDDIIYEWTGDSPPMN